MRRDDAIARLKAAEPELRALGIGALYLFGSVARDEADETSDVDVMVDFEEGTKHLLGAFLRSKDVVRDAVGARSDVLMTDGVHPAVADWVHREKLRVF